MSDGAGIENGEERNRQNWAQTKALPPRVVKRITNIQQHHKRVVKPSTNGTQTDASSVKNSAENSDTQHHLWAGAVAGMVADSIMHPFDTLSTRIKVQDGVGQDVKYKGLLQTTRTIAAEEGLLALYGGLSAAMLSTIPSTALYFATYEAVKKEGCKHVPESGAPVVHFVAGAMSELTSLTVAVPFEVIKCRMQLGANPSKVTNGAVPLTSNYHSAFHGLATVWKNEGIRGLYAGLRPCIILDCCFSVIQFALYEQTRKQMTIRREAVVAGDSPATWPPPWSELGDDLVYGPVDQSVEVSSLFTCMMHFELDDYHLQLTTTALLSHRCLCRNIFNNELICCVALLLYSFANEHNPKARKVEVAQ